MEEKHRAEIRQQMDAVLKRIDRALEMVGEYPEIEAQLREYLVALQNKLGELEKRYIGP